MQFTSEAEREQFFAAANVRGGTEPGGWLEHARSTSLGIWGSGHGLKMDCAAIASEEIRWLTGHRPETDQVARCRAFEAAYGRMRKLAAAAFREELAPHLPTGENGEPHPLIAALDRESVSLPAAERELWLKPTPELIRDVDAHIARELGLAANP